MRIPEYRVRLFLSVDLTGSTAFKHKKQNTLEWIKAFQNFYGEFPRILSSRYAEACENSPSITEHEIRTGEPKLWKTVGDEILFCCRLYSHCHLGVSINAFIEALKDFGVTAKTYSLNTKGNAWVGSFPSPNCSIMPIKINGGDAEDALNGKNDIPTEENELRVDVDPSRFDFLGKGIDAGFRISKNSAIDTLTISPGLGILLAQAAGSHRVTGFKRQIRLVEMQVFKGVANDTPYPVLTIDTSRDDRHEILLIQQRELLGQPKPPQNDELEKYLIRYLDYNGIEIPKIKSTFNEDKFEPPVFYVEYCKSWNRELETIRSQDRLRDESATVDGEEVEINPETEETLQGVVQSLSE